MTREETRIYNQKWRAAHPEKCREYTKRYLSKKPHKTKEYRDRYNAKNPGVVRLATKRWAALNRDKINAGYRKRCRENPRYKLRKNLACRMGSAIKRGLAKKASKTVALIGCSPQFLVGYLEAKFKPGMTWANHGTLWEVDHIIPCAAYDLRDESHQRSCFHYTNLQPLSVTENRRKKDSLPEHHKAHQP